MSRLVELALRHVDPTGELRIIDPACAGGDLLVELADDLVDEHGWSADRVMTHLCGADDADYGACETLGAWAESAGLSADPSIVTQGELLAFSSEPVQGMLFDETPRWRPPDHYVVGGYDLVVTRVPRRDVDGIGRDALRERFVTASGRFTFEGPFVERILELAAENGVVAVELRAAVLRRDFGRELIDRVLASMLVLEVERIDERVVIVLRPHRPGRSSALLQAFGARDAAAVLERLDEFPTRLGDEAILPIGRTSLPGCDEIWEPPAHAENMPTAFAVRGEDLGDWRTSRTRRIVWPYDGDGRRLDLPPEAATRWLARFRHTLEGRRFFGRTLQERGLRWWEYLDHHPERWASTPSIAFARSGTQPHAVLLRSPTVVTGSALAITPADDRRGAWILGMLNSSVGCFWMKHSFHVYDTSDGRAFEATAAGLARFPLPAEPDPQVVEIARKLDRLGRSVASAASAIEGDPTRLGERLDGLRAANQRILDELTYWQEELDWAVYSAFGLVDGYETAPPAPDERRLFEHDGPVRNEVEKTRRGWLDESRGLQLLESVDFKRRWAGLDDAAEPEALRIWLADQIVEAFRDGRLAADRPIGANDVRSVLQDDPLAVAVLRRLGADVAEVMLCEAVAFEPNRTYAPSGLSNLQRSAGGEPVTFSPSDFAAVGTRVPPASASANRQRMWRLRGRYDVPHERFVHLVELSEAVDRPLFGWAGAGETERESLADRVAAEGGTDQLDLERIVQMKAQLRERSASTAQIASRLWSKGWSYRAVRLALAVLEQTGTVRARGGRWQLVDQSSSSPVGGVD